MISARNEMDQHKAKQQQELEWALITLMRSTLTQEDFDTAVKNVFERAERNPVPGLSATVQRDMMMDKFGQAIVKTHSAVFNRRSYR